MVNSYWPLIPAALAELSANPVWFVEALSTKPKFRAFGSPEEAIAVATQDRPTRPDQSGRPDHHRSTLVDEPVNPSRRTGQEESCSISLSNSPPNSGSPGRSPKQRNGSRANGHLVQVEEALAIYNEVAQHHGFVECRTLTDPRRKRLGKRLQDIGGLDAFKRALAAVPRNTFLMGRVPPKDGREPFKLDLDALLQTDGRMGDVLAGLLDVADGASSTGSVDAEVLHLAASETGRAMIGDMGREAALRVIRDVIRRRGGVANG
jgi:hypothetical protein